MIRSPALAGLLVALAAPLTVLSQVRDGDIHERDTYYTTVEVAAPPVIVTVTNGAPPPAVSTTPIPLPSTTLIPAVVPAHSSSSAAAVVVAASSSPASAAPLPGTSSTPGGVSTTCSGTGMLIGWTSNSATVPFSWSGGTGSTTPGTCTDLGAFSGQLAVNGTGGTIFEGNYNGGAGMYFDVSFIIGYSAPLMCWTSTGMSGCSIDLHAHAATQNLACPQPGAGGICTNPVGSNGMATPGAYEGDMGASPWCRACSAPHAFFQPCAGSGYTYPYDDGATMSASGTIQCCVGTDCGSTGREGSTKDGNPQPHRSAEPCTLCTGGSKRGLSEAQAEAQQIRVSKKHRRSGHGHKHAQAHGGS